jgi:hypothetical protein
VPAAGPAGAARADKLPVAPGALPQVATISINAARATQRISHNPSVCLRGNNPPFVNLHSSTCNLHSRIESRAAKEKWELRIGNCKLKNARAGGPLQAVI